MAYKNIKTNKRLSSLRRRIVKAKAKRRRQAQAYNKLMEDIWRVKKPLKR